MASSPVETNELSSGAKQSSSPDDFEKSKNRLLSSSSSLSENNSSPDSPLGDPLGQEEETLLQFSQGRLSSVDDDDAQINNRNFQKNVSETSLAARDESPAGKLPVTGDSNSGNNVHLALESPPNQLMERSNTATTTTTTATTTSPYRIPSHVFKRSKSNTPVEWSLTSNESLFSIQMGNMSFTKEQFLLWRLDDVGTPGEFSPSGNLKFNCSGPLPPPPPPPRASGDSKSVDARSCEELGLREGTEEVVPKQSPVEDDHNDVKEKPAAAAVFSPEPPRSHLSVESDDAKTIRGKINNQPASGAPKKDFSLKENKADGTEKRFSGAHISRMSAESNNSTKSFAFPILEGADKSTSISISSSPKLGRDPLRIQSQTVSTSKKHQVVTDQGQSEFINSSPEATTQLKRGSGWFSCLSRCSCCR